MREFCNKQKKRVSDEGGRIVLQWKTFFLFLSTLGKVFRDTPPAVTQIVFLFCFLFNTLKKRFFLLFVFPHFLFWRFHVTQK